ncbi:hypothetical protein ACJMK2_037392 [Sinanodonta woodiana]|uniref:tRNA (adenine(58)-N(1))-methyltransferase non-catalytic subunit TRM6 n=1 Tax=Sinanodonta woodiana TaxID=1069815 RepID=A0ABD3WLJ0_SINWO
MESTCVNVIKDDSQVLIRKGENIKIFRVKKGRDIFMDNTKFSLDGAIGYPFGTTFDVVKGTLVKVAKGSNKEIESAGKDTEGTQLKDNRDLYDLDSNQKLSKEEIEKLKEEGVSGNELVEHLIENSLTFQKKTEYSKEKYIKKKKRKHVLQLTILRPTTRLLCEMYSKSAQKICYLRVDTLAQILTYGNIHAGLTLAVVDTCQGLVVGAVMERLGGFGHVIHIYHESIPNRTAVESYDFPAEKMKTLYSFPLNQVNTLTLQKTTYEVNNTCGSNSDEATNDTSEQMDVELNANKDVCDALNVDKDISEKRTDVEDIDADKLCEKSVGKNKTKGKRNLDESERKVRKEQRAKEWKDARYLLERGQLDCLIVASKLHPTPIVKALLKFVAPSRPIVVYSQFKEALMDCGVSLREEGGMVNYRLSETWLREYQVLPQRTHPKIQMSGTGGYLFTATTLAKS